MSDQKLLLTRRSLMSGSVLAAAGAVTLGHSHAAEAAAPQGEEFEQIGYSA